MIRQAMPRRLNWSPMMPYRISLVTSNPLLKITADAEPSLPDGMR
jgi:hypothetical protein